jgi:acyl-CoA dehydrogenase
MEQRGERSARCVRQFVGNEIAPIRLDLDHGDLSPYDVLRQFYEAFGLADLARARFEPPDPNTADPKDRPSHYERALATLIPMVEIARECPGLVTALGVSTNLDGGTILRKGSPEQARRWALPLST